MKIRPVGAELFHADGQTDVTKLIVAFSQYCEPALLPLSFIPYCDPVNTEYSL